MPAMSERRVALMLVALAALVLPSTAAASAGGEGPSPVPLLAELALAALIVLVKVAHTLLMRRAAAPRTAAQPRHEGAPFAKMFAHGSEPDV